MGNNINLYKKVIIPSGEINCYNYREITSSPDYVSGSLKIEKFSDIMKDWDFDKNNAEGLFPDEISALSGKYVNWKCHICGHEWRAMVSDRVGHAARCPKCSKGCHSSLPEQAIFYYIKQFFPDAINGYYDLGFELDIFIPSLNVAIEYDGEWHQKKKNKSYEFDKNKICKESGVKLIRVREDKCAKMKSNKFLKVYKYKYRDWKALENIIIDILVSLGVKQKNIDVDFNRDNLQFSKNLNLARVKNNLVEKAPNLASMFDLEKNYPIKPEYVNFGSTRKYHFTCEYGHEFYTSPNQITNSNSRKGCPRCGEILNAYEKLKPAISENGEIYPTVNNYKKIDARRINKACHDGIKVSGVTWRFLTPQEKEANKQLFVDYFFHKRKIKDEALNNDGITNNL